MGIGIKKGDTVAVLVGKEKGKKGRVLSVLPDKEGKGRRVIVEKINVIKRHTKPSKTHEQGGIIEKEGPIHISKAMLVCPKCGARTRVGAQIRADGKKFRVCKKCKEVID